VNSRRPLPFPEPSPQPQSQAPLVLLAQATQGDEKSLDLGRAALAIAAAHYVAFDMEAYLAHLDALAEEARKRLGRARRPEKIIAALNTFLFADLGFRGNTEDYYSPYNSFLNEALERRVGLPITLSILYLAITHRLNLPFVGVGMPLHFLVKYVGRGREIFLDPFYGGELLTPEGCRARLERIVRQPVEFDPAYLNATPKRQILYRLLNNLKQVYLRREEPGRAGRVVEQMLVVAPDSYGDIRDRGLLFLQESALSQAVEWLTRYLELVPEAPDAERIQNAIARAYRRRAQLN